jgi:hypothetical protein
MGVFSTVAVIKMPSIKTSEVPFADKPERNKSGQTQIHKQIAFA